MSVYNEDRQGSNNLATIVITNKKATIKEKE